MQEDLIFSHCLLLKKTFFRHKIFVITLRDAVGLENFYCFSANHNPELRCVICTGVTLVALVLHLNCTALSQSESSNFFMYIINWIRINLLVLTETSGSIDSYRSRDEVQSIRKTRDPITGLREKLLDSGLADADEIKVTSFSDKLNNFENE